jgi:hypothetical protein
MNAVQLRDDLVHLLERIGVHPDLMGDSHDVTRHITQSIYVTRRDLEHPVGPTLDFHIDVQGRGASVVIEDVPSKRVGVSETQHGAWTLSDVERSIPVWLERLAALRGEDCPDCQGVPAGEVQEAVQSGCDACGGIGRVNQAPLRVE